MVRVLVGIGLLVGLLPGCGSDGSGPLPPETDGTSASASSTTSPSTTGASASSSGTAGTTGADAADAACRAMCESKAAAGCTNDPDLEFCVAACNSLLDSFQGLCVDEQVAVLSCSAPGGYDCINGISVERNACPAENAAYSECFATRGCVGWCFIEAELGCPTATCAEDCAARLADPACGMAFARVVDCGFTFDDLDCVDDRLVGDYDFCNDDQAEYDACVQMARG
jgi:hypothetical protein